MNIVLYFNEGASLQFFLFFFFFISITTFFSFEIFVQIFSIIFLVIILIVFIFILVIQICSVSFRSSSCSFFPFVNGAANREFDVVVINLLPHFSLRQNKNLR